MGLNFTDRLQHAVTQRNSLLCVGLDPDRGRMPAFLASSSEGVFEFCAKIIENTHSAAAAFKLNFAFFEALGSKGWAVLERLVPLIPEGILKLADAKRADIGNTSEMYARAILEHLGFDALTVNPYLGHDAVAPFLRRAEKGAFVLCLTSNPGNRDFQYFSDGQRTLYEAVCDQVLTWNARRNCGLVVGATRPEELRHLRQRAGDLPFLIPGVGAQGGQLREAVVYGTDASGGGALVNVSRGILYKSAGEDFATAAGAEAARLRDEINQYRDQKRTDA